MGETDRYLPLTSKAFHILLALAEGPRNGYQVSARVEENSRGAVRLGPASQFENIQRLTEKGLIEEVDDDPSLAADGRGQRFWRVTSLGVAVMRAEMERLQGDLGLARRNPMLRSTE